MHAVVFQRPCVRMAGTLIVCVCVCAGAAVATVYILGSEVLQSEEQAQSCGPIVHKDVDACKVFVHDAMVV